MSGNGSAGGPAHSVGTSWRVQGAGRAGLFSAAELPNSGETQLAPIDSARFAEQTPGVPWRRRAT